MFKAVQLVDHHPGHRIPLTVSTKERFETINIEFYSNGFKIIRDTTNDDSNRNNEGYLYMAWAEDALSGQFGATSNAR